MHACVLHRSLKLIVMHLPAPTLPCTHPRKYVTLTPNSSSISVALAMPQPHKGHNIRYGTHHMDLLGTGSHCPCQPFDQNETTDSDSDSSDNETADSSNTTWRGVSSTTSSTIRTVDSVAKQKRLLHTLSDHSDRDINLALMAHALVRLECYDLAATTAERCVEETSRDGQSGLPLFYARRALARATRPLARSALGESIAALESNAEPNFREAVQKSQDAQKHAGTAFRASAELVGSPDALPAAAQERAVQSAHALLHCDSCLLPCASDSTYQHASASAGTLPI